MTRTEQRLGRMDVLVNNAAIHYYTVTTVATGRQLEF
jgi:NAD(P)-dependent dehydrogenase (short-subunit alcohol dehydrogenase family)